MALAKRPFSVAAGAGGTTIVPGPTGLFGVNLREIAASATAGTLQIYDNTSAAGTLLATIRFGADGENQVNWTKGVKAANGLHLVATGGDVAGALMIGSDPGLKAIPFAGADLLLFTGACTLDSIMAVETAASPAEWRVFDALTATGTAFAGATLASENFRLEWPPGLAITNGLFFDQQSGSVSGNVYIQ